MATLRLELMVKDLSLATQLAADCGAPMLIANAVRSTVKAAANELGKDANVDDIVKLFEAPADVCFAVALFAGAQRPSSSLPYNHYIGTGFN